MKAIDDMTANTSPPQMPNHIAPRTIGVSRREKMQQAYNDYNENKDGKKDFSHG
jgi:hypothetical protein